MLAKITRPKNSGVIQRDRLLTLLDDKLAKPVTWLSAPGGTGKTTLVSSYLDVSQLPCLWYQCDEGDADLATFFHYMGLAARQAIPRFRTRLPLLTPEYLAGIPAFTKRYFETLYSRILNYTGSKSLQPCFVIVLDNYQDVPAETPFHDMIANGFDGIPDGVRFMVLSRCPPPPATARLQANGGIALLDHADVRFTFDESRELIQNRMPSLDLQSIARMHDKTEGWAAGIILMLESLVLNRNSGGALPLEDFDCGRVFDYFAGAVFVRAENHIKDFLLRTSLLPMLNVTLAKRLTGVVNACEILSGLHRHHLFTEKLSGTDQDYRYHPLLRDFLLSRMKTVYSQEEVLQIKRDAAQLMEQSGNWEVAAQLYCESGDHDSLAMLVNCHGRELLMQGRCKVLAELMTCFPREMADNDPWLLYWDGMSSFPVDLPRTRLLLEKALSLFKLKSDSSGSYLAWAGIVDTHVFGDDWKSLDECISDFNGLQRNHPVFNSLEVELTASSRMLLSLTLRKTDNPQLVERWQQRVGELLKQKPSMEIQIDTVFGMSVFYLWRGDYEKNSLLLERAAMDIRHRQPSPFTVIRIKLMKGIHCWLTADYQIALQTLSEALEVSARSGVHIYDPLLWSFKTAAEMAPGNLANAELSLKQQMHCLPGAESSLNVFFYHINAAWLAILTNNLSLAAEHMDNVFPQTERMGTTYYNALWHIGMAQISFLQGRAGQASDHLRTVRDISRAMKSCVLEWYSLLVEAWSLIREGKREEGLAPLQNAMALGRRNGYVHLEFYQPSQMALLCATALEERIETEYVTELVGKLALTPPFAETGRATWNGYLEEWPYPVRIYTLGRFEIIRDGKPLHFSGKEQKKPLEMLKVLIARCGRDVPKERLTDALWPDADGDQAGKSFEMTLSRLRRLLGEDRIIVYRARQLSINPLYCWVDSLALAQHFDRNQEVPVEQVVRLCNKAISLYKGAFLPSDPGLSSAVSCRETLKNRLLRLVMIAGRHYEQLEAWDQAADYYQKGIETDNLAEEFYRRLMICQRQLGNHAETVRTYIHCSSLLRAELGIEPSPETTAVYSSIVRKK